MMTQSTASELSETGISVIGDLPWGTHFCYFYETKDDLLETLVLYFKTGLERKEFCVWVVPQALSVEEARQALAQAVPDLKSHLERGTLEIHRHDEWYLRDGRWDAQRVIQSWHDKLSQSSGNGHAGLRACGDGGWVQDGDWMAFRDYEKQVSALIADQRSIVLCTYPLATSSGDQVFDVAHIHQIAAARRNGSWETVETPALKQAKAEIKKLNQELEQKIEERTRELAATNAALKIEIAERKSAQEAVKQAENRIRLVIDTIPAMAWTLWPDGGVELVNQRWLDYSGVSLEEERADTVRPIHPEDRERVMEKWCVAKAAGAPLEDEMRLRRADGEYRWFLVRTVPLRDEHGNIIRWYGASSDIEDRKQAEMQAWTLIDAIPQQIWSSPPDGATDYCNERWRAYTGLELENVRGYGWQTMVHPEDRERVLKAWHESVVNGTPYEQEERHRGTDGTYRWFLSLGVPLHNAEGRIVRWYGTNTDIEDRKRAEEALRESEARFRRLLSSDIIGVAFWNLSGEIREANDLFLETIGYTREDLCRGEIDWKKLTPPEYAAKDAKAIDELLATGTCTPFEKEYVRKDGERVTVSIGSALFDVEKQAGTSFILDITERKQNEKRLREYEKVVEGLEEMIVVVDRDYRYLLANRAFLKYRGVEWEDLVGHLAAELFAEGVFENVVKEKLDECLRGNPVRYEMKYCYPQHGERDLLISYFPIEGRAGIDRVACVLQDITERKKAEAALRESETRFRQIAENIEEMFWITDLKGSKTIYMSPAYERITGRSCESLYAAPKSWREDIHPEDQLRMEATFVADPGSTGDHAYRILRPDGSIRWIRDRGFPVRDESGEVVRFAGIAEDITASKCAEKELQQVNEQLRVLSRRLFHVRDEERRHLARELHDEIGQTLTAAKINLDSIGRSVASDQTSRLNETITILDKLLRQVRQISLDLHPSMLDDLGLAPALRSLLDQQARRAGWRAQFSAVEPLANIKRGIQTTGFRIAQEAITNILRHANAGFVSVHLRTETGELRMKIVDDGRGFDLAEIEGHTYPDGGFGLMGMRERAASVGGRVQIVSSPSTGTTVEVSLPLNGSGQGRSG
jgi:PAS domain S-box-containing protein